MSAYPGPGRFGLIVGAMKCGTTSLFEYLSQHPEVCPCQEKEPEYFTRPGFSPERFDEYRALWPGWDPRVHRIALEASTSYTKRPFRPEAAERIAAVSGADFRFVYVMRDPLERMESQAHHGLYAGWHPSLDQGVGERLLQISRYAFQLDPFRARFSPDRIHCVVLEELRESPERVMERLCRFLGIDPAFRFRGLRRAHNRRETLRALPPWVKRLRGPWVKRIPSAVRETLVRALGRRVEGRTRLTESERAHYRERLEEDLRRLREEYGVDTSYWKLSEGASRGSPARTPARG